MQSFNYSTSNSLEMNSTNRGTMLRACPVSELEHCLDVTQVLSSKQLGLSFNYSSYTKNSVVHLQLEHLKTMAFTTFTKYYSKEARDLHRI